MKKKVAKLFLLLAVISVAVGITIIVKPELFPFAHAKTPEISLVQDNLEELSEWTTLKYDYSTVIVSRTNKNFSLLGSKEINYGEAIKLIEYSGYLKAGTDLSKVQLSYNKVSKNLSVKLPKSQILDNVVETDKTKIEDVKGNILSDYPTQTIFDEINANKKELEEKKIEDGFLDEADQRIQSLLTSFLKTNGFDNVSIELI